MRSSRMRGSGRSGDENQTEAVVVEESRRHVRAKGVADAALGGAAARQELRIAPEHLSHEAWKVRLHHVGWRVKEKIPVSGGSLRRSKP